MKRGVLYASLIALTISIFGCSKYKVASFVMPTWDTQFSAPIFNRTYTLWEILSKDSTNVSNGDTTFLRAVAPSYTFTILRSQNLNGVEVGSNLKIGAVPQTKVADSPKDFSIANPPSIHYAAANPAIVPGPVPAVPAIPARAESITPSDAFTNFKTATLSSGTLAITIHNGYPAAINFTNGLNLIDANGNSVNIGVPGNSIPANQTVTLPSKSLAGVTITNQPTVEFTYSSPGSSSAATIQSDTVIAFSSVLSNVHVSAANAIVPPQPDIVIDSSIVISDGNKVQTAQIDTGTVNLSVTNNFNVSIPVHLVIPGLTLNGTALSRTFTLAAKGNAGSSYAEAISLDNYVLNMADSHGNPSDSLKYSVTAQLPGSNGNFVNIATTDSVSATFNLNGLEMKSFTGEVHLTDPVNIATDTQKVDLGDFNSKFSGTIQFGPNTQLTLKIKSIGFPCRAHISLIPASSELPNGPVDSAVVDTDIFPNVTNTIVLGSSFVNVLNNFTRVTNRMPDEFIIGGHVDVNPSPLTTVGSVTDTDKVSGTGTISMPLSIGLVNATYSDTTKNAAVNDSSTASKLGNVDSASVTFEIWNGLPLGITMIGQLIDTTTHMPVAFLPTDSIQIAPATVNSDGSVRDSVYSKTVFKLDNFQAKNLGNSYMRFFLRVATPTTGGVTTVPFQKTNSISLKVYGNFAFKVDKDLVGK